MCADCFYALIDIEWRMSKYTIYVWNIYNSSQQLQSSSIGNKSFERRRKQKMLYSKERVAKGGGKAVASDVLGSREVPLLCCKWRDWEKVGAQIQWDMLLDEDFKDWKMFSHPLRAGKLECNSGAFALSNLSLVWYFVLIFILTTLWTLSHSLYWVYFLRFL